MIGFDFQGLGIFQTLIRGTRIEAAARQALEAEAEQLAEAIRDAAPADSGALRDSVRVEPGDEALSVTVTAGGTPETTRTNAEGVTFDEALMLEFGTSRSPAQPFFWPAVEANRDKIKANIDGAMDGATGDE